MDEAFKENHAQYISKEEMRAETVTIVRLHTCIKNNHVRRTFELRRIQ